MKQTNKEVLEKCKTSHITVRECFSGGCAAIFQFNKYVSISSGLCSALEEIDPISCYLTLKYTPIMGLTDITDFKKKKKPVYTCSIEILQLRAFLMYVV